MAQGKGPKTDQKKSPKRKNKTFQERCDEVYVFFMKYYLKYHVAPSYTDMTKGTGVKQRGNLAPIIQHLIADGKLERMDNTPRGLWPANSTYGSLTLPDKGEISADNRNPLVILDQPDPTATLEVPRYLLPKNVTLSNCYVLKVKGDSMKKANIFNEDYVVIQSRDAYRDDDIVAVLLKDENAVTLKMLKQTARGNIKLQPKSHKHQPRIEKPENIEVQGCVVAVMRKC